MEKRAPFSHAELPIGSDGRLHHTHLLPEELASDILLVGDPGRASFISEHFLESVQVAVEHRGLRSFTGVIKGTGQRISVMTSGMGTPSLEIVLQEIGILKQIDLRTRTFKGLSEPLRIIRIGTSGGLQADTALGTAIIARYAIGLDNTGLFYEAAAEDTHCVRLEAELYEYLKQNTPRGSRFFGKIYPYVSRADSELSAELSRVAAELGYPFRDGITVSNSGFFANQGRDIPSLRPSIPDIDVLLGDFNPRIEALRIENMEMEASALFHLGQGHGFATAALCPAIANRRLETMSSEIESCIGRAVEIALRALQHLR